MYQMAGPATGMRMARKGYRVVRRNAMVVGPGSYTFADPTLGFSLNPFKLIGSAVRAVVGVVRGSSVTIPTAGGGTTTIPTAQIPAVLRGAQVQIGAPQTPTQQVSAMVESVPGGWLTLAAVGVGAIVLTSVLSRRGR